MSRRLAGIVLARIGAAAALWVGCLLAFHDASAAPMKFIKSFDGVRIAYEEAGSGAPTLVFVHGWACDRSYWSAQLPRFARRFHVVALDLGGHGQSGLARKDWTIASFGRDVATLVQTLQLDQVILIGHSMGGDVVAEAARHLKGRVIGLVWLDTYNQLGAGRSEESVDAFVNNLRGNFPQATRELVRGLFIPSSDPAIVEGVAAKMSSMPLEVALPALHSSFSYSRQITRTLRELNLPVVTINSDRQPTDIESMKRAGVDVLILPGVSHFMMIEDPQRVNRLLEVQIERMRRAHWTPPQPPGD